MGRYEVQVFDEAVGVWVFVGAYDAADAAGAEDQALADRLVRPAVAFVEAIGAWVFVSKSDASDAEDQALAARLVRPAVAFVEARRIG